MGWVQRVTAKAVIKNENKILLVKEPDNRWEFPGGKIEFGHHIEETLVKELKEELGITELKIGKIINVWDWIFNLEHINLQFFMLAFDCRTNQKEFKLSKEHTGYGWFNKQDALTMNLTEGTRKTLEML